MCARTHTSWYNCPRRPKEDIGSRGTGVTGGCKPFDMLVLETELKFLETQKEHLTVSTRPINTHSVRLPVSSLQAAPSFRSDDSLFITGISAPLGILCTSGNASSDGSNHHLTEKRTPGDIPRHEPWDECTPLSRLVPTASWIWHVKSLSVTFQVPADSH